VLRLMFVTSSLPNGGAERHAIALMNGLTERGHECHAVYVKDSGCAPDGLRLGARGTVRCLHAARFLDRRALADFARHIGRLRPDAVVAANPYPLLYARLALRRARQRVPLVVTYHSTKLLGLKARLQMLAYRPLLWGADCAVFVARAQRRYCLLRGVCARRNDVIHNGVDTEYFVPCDRQQSAAVRRAFGFSDTDYVLGMSAWLRPEKNHVQLVDALARLRARGVRARALLIGDGETRGAIEARVRALRLDGDVRIAGAQADVRPYVAACDALVLCSVAIETFSLAALEAMAMGKPVVHADLGGAAEMIRPGHNGFLFPPGDTPALVEHLAVLADRARAARMGEAARAWVQARFSEQTMVDRYAALLAALCAQRTGAAAPRLAGARKR
jgi:glycosyltransferase involved in cell wall biosynthesis